MAVMPNERTRVRLSGSADRLVIQIELTRSGRPGSDQFSQDALADLPGAVHHHDAGICRRIDGRSAEWAMGGLPVLRWPICRPLVP
jgi:hypothetical protein